MASISAAVYSCTALRDLLLKIILTTIDAELVDLCKRNTPSMFRRLSIDAIDWSYILHITTGAEGTYSP